MAYKSNRTRRSRFFKSIEYHLRLPGHRNLLMLPILPVRLAHLTIIHHGLACILYRQQVQKEMKGDPYLYSKFSDTSIEQ